ncbi:MAG: ribonuclease P protein component [Deltaproteobacteria bacterium]|nr:ribonuclease P protein component [Deltaproteobacteria bacterium]
MKRATKQMGLCRQPGERFTRSERINDGRLIRRIRNRGESFKGGGIRLFRLQNDFGRPRLALVFTRRFGPSVVRNRARRLIREFFRKNKGSLGCWDYLFFSDRPLPSFSKTDWHEMFKFILNGCGTKPDDKKQV